MMQTTFVTKDPVCGKPIDKATALHVERDGRKYYFCSAECRQKYLSDPVIAKREAKPSVRDGGHDHGEVT